MKDNTIEFEIIRPGEPGYAEHAPKVDALGGKPTPLVAMLRFLESELCELKKLKKQGFKTTIPELADSSGEEIKARPIDERIAELKKMFSEFEEVIAWAETKRPGSSKNESGSLLLAEYEKETGKKA